MTEPASTTSTSLAVPAPLRAAIDGACDDGAGRRLAVAAAARLAFRRLARRAKGSRAPLPFPRDLAGLPGLDPEGVARIEKRLAREIDGALSSLGDSVEPLRAILSHLALVEESRRHGVVYTPPSLASLMVRLALDAADRRRAAPVRALDPACGSGAFLEAMAAAAPCAEVHGIERDPCAAHAARLRLFALDLLAGRPYSPVEKRVVCADALQDGAPLGAAGSGFDVVVANPPYVRQERLDARTKEILHDRLGKLESGALSRRSDLFVYFFVRLRELLREGGAAAVVTPSSWLHTAYGAALRRFLLREFQLHTVLETDAERWFEGADVHGLVVVLRRARSRAAVRFAVRVRPLRAALEPASEPIAAPAYRVRRARPEELERREARGGPPWALELRAPDVFLDLLERARDRLVPLGDVSRVRFGGKTGANSFFYVTPEPRAAGARGERLVRTLSRLPGVPSRPLRLPAAWIEPALLSPRELRRHVVRAGDPKRCVLRLPLEREAMEGTDAEILLRAAEAAGVPARPSIRGHVPWYALPASPAVPLLHSLIVDERPGAFLLETRCWVDANFDTVQPIAPAAPEDLFASMASSFGLLARELYLPSNLGQGALKANPAYLRTLPVLDARRVPADLLRALRAAARSLAEQDPRQAGAGGGAAREALDLAFFRAAGVRGDLRAQARRMRAALEDALEARRRRSRR